MVKDEYKNLKICVSEFYHQLENLIYASRKF